MSRPTLTTTIQHGTLAHVLSIRGQAFQSYPTIKLAMAALLLAMAASGCQTMREHPRTTAFIAGSLVISLGTHHSSNDADRHIATPSVDCSAPSACK